MSVCPICKNEHQEEVSKCQRCNWSMQDDLDSIEINSEHPILSICIPKLVKSLEHRNNLEEKLSLLIQTSDPDIQQKNNERLDEFLDKLENYKLDKLLERLETEREKYIQEIKDFKTQVLEELKKSLESKNDTSQINIEMKNDSSNSESITPLSTLKNTPVHFDNGTTINLDSNNHDSLDFKASDRDENDVFNMNNDYQEVSLYSQTGDRNFSELIESEIYTKSDNTSNSYQGLYRLIRNRELEVIEVAVTQESMEKMRGGTLSELLVSKTPRGNYWIINWSDTYCLIPKAKINIDQYNYGNFQRIFKCQNYHDNYSDFELIEPAMVSNRDEETWQLERKGQIKFI